MPDLPPYRAEPDAEFADRLERELLRRLTAPAVATLTEVALVTYVPETDDDVITTDLQDADRRRRPSRIPLVASGLVAAGLVAVLALVVRNSGDSEPAVAPPAGNGLIAFAANPGDGSAQSDIYVIAPDGTGLRALTSTPELADYVPTWSPDGSLLAFVRTGLPAAPIAAYRNCTPSCQLVVVDPTTGVETFSADLPQPDRVGDAWVPVSLAWSADGRAIMAHSVNCGPGGCGGSNSVIADLDTGALTTFRGDGVTWSPDAEWLLVQGTESRLLLVPADLIGTGDVVDIAKLPGVRPLLEAPGEDVGRIEWMPDSSAIVVEGGRSIDLVTVADGQRRTLIEDGFGPVVSPDGSHIAYLRGSVSADVNEIWVGGADGSGQRLVTVSSTPPVWSPDGSLLLASDANDGWFTVRPDGTERTQITPFIPRAPLGLPDAHALCCPDYRPSWQPLSPGSGPDDRRVGFVGLPPEGATPSTPERGERIMYVAGPELGSRTWVYADGRLIWHRYANLPEGANEVFTGFLEQRLTPEGVELLRSEAVSLIAELLDDQRAGGPPGSTTSDSPQACSWNLCEIRVRNNGRLDRLAWPPGEASALVARITDPASWLPASAWEDQEIKAYVPSRYSVLMEPRDSTLLPEAAQDLLEDPVLTLAEVRALDQALDDAGIEQNSTAMEDGVRGPSRYSLTYRIDRGGDETPTIERRYIIVEPYLPHGGVYCQHCG